MFAQLFLATLMLGLLGLVALAGAEQMRSFSVAWVGLSVYAFLALCWGIAFKRRSQEIWLSRAYSHTSRVEPLPGAFARGAGWGLLWWGLGLGALWLDARRLATDELINYGLGAFLALVLVPPVVGWLWRVKSSARIPNPHVTREAPVTVASAGRATWGLAKVLLLIVLALLGFIFLVFFGPWLLILLVKAF